MNSKFIKLLKIYIKRHSLLRILQIRECLNLKLIGNSVEFGAIDNKDKTFSSFFTGKSKFKYSNLKKKNNTMPFDLTKNLKISKNTFNNVILFNVMEHLPSYNKTFSEIYRITKKGGLFVGSTPFLYQVHGAPKDYFRFTKQFFEFNLKKNNFKNIKIKTLGFGPFTASYSLLSSYLKYLPIISDLLLLISYLLDLFIQLFVKTNLKEIYPIGIFFSARK
jgi:SAM-dependent methyltransferase